MTNAIIYARFSPRPKAQVEKTDSLEKQEDLCREYCKDKEYHVVRVFCDPDRGGADENRPGVWAAVDAIKRNWVLVALDDARIARDRWLSLHLRREIASKQARIEVVNGTNGDSIEDEMTRDLQGLIDQYERRKTGFRTKQAMLRHQRMGRIMSKSLPYGYRTAPDSPLHDISGLPTAMVEDQDEQANIAKMQVLRCQGLGYKAIGIRMDKEGFHSRSAARWYASTVRTILIREGLSD